MAGPSRVGAGEARVLTTLDQRRRRVVVDALAARFGGTAYAAVQTARRLAGGPDIDEVVVAAGTGSIVAMALRDEHVVLRAVAAGDRSIGRRVAWESLRLPQVVSEHCGTALLSWSGILPRRVGAPVVSYLANPMMFTGNGAGDRLRRRAARRTASRAAAVLVPSDGMRDLVEPVLGREVAVVPLGVDAERFSPGATPGNEILCVADFYAHKRHDAVLAAWARLPPPRPDLRLVGNPRVDPRAFRRVAERVEALRPLGLIRLEHGLTLDKLIEAYRVARVLVIASEAESFCMPLLEAQACGVPVVTRELVTLRTAAGAAATFVGGDDPRDWAAALERLLTDDAAHAAAAAAGHAHARDMTWERTVLGLRHALTMA